MASWAYLTAEVAPAPARIKARPEDFVVWERPGFEPSGAGGHLILRVEKRGLTTDALVDRLARDFGADRRQIGYAGLKDRHALTEQSLSLPAGDGISPEVLLGWSCPGARVLSAGWHHRKLRRGQARGNRFELTLRGLADGHRPRLLAALARLREVGLPNYYGAQRFGVRGRNHLVGRELIRERWREAALRLAGDPLPSDPPSAREAREAFAAGDFARAWARFPRYLGHERALAGHLRRRPADHRGAWRRIHGRARSLLMASFQAYAFNRQLELDVRAGARGPATHAAMPGFKTAGDREVACDEAWLASALSGVDPWAALRKAKLAGERRRLWLTIEVELTRRDGWPCLRVDLPNGTYATALLREITKDDPPLAALGS